MSTRTAATARDAGLASVAVVAGSAVLFAAVVAGLVVADLVGSRSRAGTAADLAALAAAGAALEGDLAACRRAAVIATANRARLETCHVGGDSGADADVVVSVELVGPARAVAERLGAEVPRLRARALAGPARSG